MKYMITDDVNSFRRVFFVPGSRGIEGLSRALRLNVYNPRQHEMQYYCEHSQRWYAIRPEYADSANPEVAP